MTPQARWGEYRIQARLAWNNWPDNEVSRRGIAEQEARDPCSAMAWDRVIEAILLCRDHNGAKS